jgi:hypothetical protein
MIPDFGVRACVRMLSPQNPGNFTANPIIHTLKDDFYTLFILPNPVFSLCLHSTAKMEIIPVSQVIHLL